MVEAAGVRVRWPDLPAFVHTAVAEILGSPVVEAVSQRGGFSPGSADRVVAADGTRAFVKAVDATTYPDSAGMHRREMVVAGALPVDAPVPRLLGSHDDGEWVVLVQADVDGRHPHLPWRADDLEATRRAFEALAAVPLTGALADLPDVGTRLGSMFDGWERLRVDPSTDLDPWAAARVDRLAASASSALSAVEGTELLHNDVRADNLLVRPDGSVVVVDWPWASRGAAWFDRLALLVNVGLHAQDAPLDRLADDWLPEVPAREVDAALAGVAGYFVDAARRPDPPGLPTVRAFQRAQGEVVLRWLRQRWEGR